MNIFDLNSVIKSFSKENIFNALDQIFKGWIKGNDIFKRLLNIREYIIKEHNKLLSYQNFKHVDIINI